MLYPRWLETSRRHASRPAIHDGSRRFTFAELAAEVARAPRATQPVVARTGGMAFFVEVLRAWRDGQAVIPVERDVVDPVLNVLPPDGTCLVKYTPGASGIPRGIFFRDEHIEADGDRLVAAMELDASTPNLAVISLAHSYGFSNVVLPLVLHGVPIHLAPVPFPRVIAEIFQQHRSWVVPSVPSIWRAWHRADILRGAPIRLAISAGSPLPLALEREVFASADLKIHNFYGASECGGIAYDRSITPRESAEEVGSLLPGVRVSTGRDGRLEVQSSAVAAGYDAKRDDDVLGDGRYLTRDLGHFDATGRLFLAGTVGGAINVAGRKVSPSKVEAALLATGLVKRVRVSGIQSRDAERFEEILATVELQPAVRLETVKVAVSARLQSWEMPRHWQLEVGGNQGVK